MKTQFFHREAFTIIELLVVIGIVTVLLAILLPMIGSAIDHSRRVGSEANLRSIATVFDLYIDDARGQYPASVEGEIYQTPRSILRATLPYWQSADQWNLLFHDRYPWESNINMFLAPGAERDLSMLPLMSTVFPSYQYSATFLGDPKIWSGADITSDEWDGLLSSVRRSAVRYPSGKVLLWDVELPTIRRDLERDLYSNLNEQSPMVFADGHTEVRVPARANEGVTNWAHTATHPHQYLHNTRDGVFGRDY